MKEAPYLFSIDLEDVRHMMADGDLFRPRVEQNTEVYLDFLRRHGAQCTFFTVGDVLRAYPDMVMRIAAEGHEIACHTNCHGYLENLGPHGFRRDIEKWLSEAERLGLPQPKGFRAPAFSLAEHCAWAYPILKELGFSYSSSVLPARNPLYGWPGFGQRHRMVDGILEIPMSLATLGPLQVPFGGGVYFRVLPWFIVRFFFQREKGKGNPVLGYFHPYDVDTVQERFMHPAIKGNRLMNALMYMGRDRVIPRLERVVSFGMPIARYDSFAEQQLAGNTELRASEASRPSE